MLGLTQDANSIVRVLHLTPALNPQTTFSFWKLCNAASSVQSSEPKGTFLASLKVKQGVNAKGQYPTSRDENGF